MYSYREFWIINWWWAASFIPF